MTKMYNPNRNLPLVTPKHLSYKNKVNMIKIKPNSSDLFKDLKLDIIDDVFESRNHLFQKEADDMKEYGNYLHKNIESVINTSIKDKKLKDEKVQKILEENEKQKLRLIIGEIYAVGVRIEKDKAKFKTIEAYEQWAKNKPNGDIKGVLEKYVDKIDKIYNPPPPITPLNWFNDKWSMRFDKLHYGIDTARLIMDYTSAQFDKDYLSTWLNKNI